jgi:hypothetical protein
MPMTPTRILLPNRSEISRRAGVTLSVSSTPPRLTSKVSWRSALPLTMRCMSANVSIGWPSMLTITSPGLKPALAAYPFGHQLVDPRGRHLNADKRERHRENDDGQDEVGYRAGCHDGRSRRQRFGLERAGLLVGRHALQGRLGGNAGTVLVVEELDIAAERDPSDAPAGAVPVVKTVDLLAEADGKGLDLHAAPAGDQEMAELVNEHDHRQDEQEGQQYSQEAPDPAQSLTQESHLQQPPATILNDNNPVRRSLRGRQGPCPQQVQSQPSCCRVGGEHGAQVLRAA